MFVSEIELIREVKYTLKHRVTLLEAVMEIYKGVSKQKAKQIIGYSEFTVNGRQISRHPAQIIGTGNELEIIQHDKNPVRQRIPDRRTPVVICFEDPYFIVALKPAGILSCGSKDQVVNNSYHKILETYLSDRDRTKVRLWIVHRLDREVEGLILFAKSEQLQEQIKAMWPNVTKKYLALTENKPDPPQGIIENWLIDASKQKVIISDREISGSKYARTEYTCLKAEKSYQLVEITLHTGRRNQIRAHLAGINCPIVGDRKYGADSSFVRQIRLAACKLEFRHPVTEKTVSVHYKLPKRFFRPSQDSDEKYKIL